MKKQMKLTTKEENLIIAIRNFRESLHNPSEELEWYARRLFEEIIDGEDDEERRKLIKKNLEKNNTIWK